MYIHLDKYLAMQHIKDWITTKHITNATGYIQPIKEKESPEKNLQSLNVNP